MQTGEKFDPWKMTKLFAPLGAGVTLACGLLVLWAASDAPNPEPVASFVGGTLVGLLPGALLWCIGSMLDRMRLTSYAIRQGAPQRISHHRW